MRLFKVSLIIALGTALLGLGTSAQQYKAVLGLDLAELDQREVLVIRTTGDVPVPGVFSREEAAAKVTFVLSGAQANGVVAPGGGLALIKAVSIDPSAPNGASITVTLAKPELARLDCFRLSQPSRHVILFEVFSQAGLKDGASPILDPEHELDLNGLAAGPTPGTTAPATREPVFAPDQLGIPTMDLRHIDPSKVMGLAAKAGLLDVNGRAVVETESLGAVVVRPAGQSLASWVGATPPGVLYLAGTPNELADFMRSVDPAQMNKALSFERYWGANQRARPAKTVLSGRSSAMRSRLKDDPFSGLYFAEHMPGGTMLSDIRVTLPAISGMNLYEVLDYLSTISGISLIVDPYAFEAPTGSTRPPMAPEQPPAAGNQPGYRPGDVFDPQYPGGGSVIGNFIDMPFDTALSLILETQELEFVVYDSGSGNSNKRYGGKPSRDPSQAYSKPVILITNRQRVEQELAGTNQIDLYQLHYADPGLLTNLLGSFDLLPGTDSGWYIYGGNGNTVGGGDGGQGGGNQGGAGGIGGGTRSTGIRPGGGSNAVMVYRGASRGPVETAVGQAVADGQSVIRIELRPESTGQLVTLFAQ